MIPLDRFAPKSRLRCCGTCREWTERKSKRGSAPYCPRVGLMAPDEDLTACGCPEWVYEQRESYAVGLYAELAHGGAQ